MKQLLVEGNNDKHVVWALCEKYGIDETFEVNNCSNVTKLYEATRVRLKQSNTKTLGIIIDADSDISKRWREIKALLSESGFTMPDELPRTGLIVSNDDGVRVGVWIMPDNDTNGMLEDFMTFLIPDDDKLLPVVDATLESIETQELNKYKSTHKAKARIHTWLSWQEDPGTPMGQSITKKYFSTENNNCDKFINWLQHLFTEPA